MSDEPELNVYELKSIGGVAEYDDDDDEDEGNRDDLVVVVVAASNSSLRLSMLKFNVLGTVVDQIFAI